MCFCVSRFVAFELQSSLVFMFQFSLYLPSKNGKFRFLNPEEIQIWEGENESVRFRQHLILQLLLVVAAFCSFNKQELNAMVTA